MIGRKLPGKENYETNDDYRKDKTVLESDLVLYLPLSAASFRSIYS